jgi:hypothetical protein
MYCSINYTHLITVSYTETYSVFAIIYWLIIVLDLIVYHTLIKSTFVLDHLSHYQRLKDPTL